MYINNVHTISEAARDTQPAPHVALYGLPRYISSHMHLRICVYMYIITHTYI